MNTLLLASSNAHKLHELRAMLSENIELKDLKSLNDQDEVFECGLSFKENARIKAKYYYDKYKIPTLADDSGLEISYLNNLPGVHSARLLKDNLNYRNRFVLDLMKDIKNREARFCCCLCLYDGKEYKYFVGEVKGEIATEIKGENGFGYDPIFYLPQLDKTMAQLNEEEKNRVSHRGNAFRKLVAYLG